MQSITAENAASYLRATGRIQPDAVVAVRELTGGVSNVVLLVEEPGKPAWVLKQSRERLRVALEWLSPLERIWTEVATLRLLRGLVPQGTVPEVLFEDRERFLFGMTAAPPGAEVWKIRLLAGQAGDTTAAQAGTFLGRVHRRAADSPALLRAPLKDPGLFDSLRIDPYYRTVARGTPDLRGPLNDLIASMTGPDRTLVLGDFSPKNILVSEGGLIVLDFETAHAGDPAFDLGFFASHLILKAFRARRLGGSPQELVASLGQFLEAYTAEAQVDGSGSRSQRGARHAAACLLARLDGKSPVEYRPDLDADAVRRLARDVLASNPPIDLAELREDVARQMLSI